MIIHHLLPPLEDLPISSVTHVVDENIRLKTGSSGGTTSFPRDIQRRAAACNTKYGDSPTNHRYPGLEKSFHALPPPDHRVLLSWNVLEQLQP